MNLRDSKDKLFRDPLQEATGPVLLAARSDTWKG